MKQIQVKVDDSSLRMATGKEVNSALDDPDRFFSAKGLDDRARDLGVLLDSMSQSIQMIKMADDTIESVSKFIDKAKSFTNSALEEGILEANVTSSVDFDSVSDIGEDVEGVNDGDVFNIRKGKIKENETSKIVIDKADLVSDVSGVNDGDEITVKVGDDETTLTISSGDSIFDLRDSIEAIDNIKTDFDSDGKLKISTTNGSALFIDDKTGTSAEALGFDMGTDIEIEDGDKPSDLVSKINDIDGFSAKIDGDSLTIASNDGHNFVVSDVTGSAAEAMKIDGATTNGKNNREVYLREFNAVLSQIDDLTNDAYYKGVNLTKGDNQTVYFNSERTSSLTIEGENITRNSLGIKEVREWSDKEDIRQSLFQLEDAQRSLRGIAEKLGNNLNSISVRQDATEGIIENLQNGADKLVVGDLNEMGAEALSIQTRQQLAAKSFAMTSNWVQGVLQMF
jgi:hypothetical protein